VETLLLQQQVQHQVQQVAAAIAVQQHQQAAAAMQQQQQMVCNAGVGTGMTPPDAYGLAAMSCSPGAAGAVGSTSPLSAR
jgi:GTP cyclohydrolase III